MIGPVHRVQPRLVAADTARVWPVVAAGAWAVAIRLPVVGEPVFRWGWVPVTAVMFADLARRHLPVPVLRRFGLLAVWWGWAAVTLLWSPDPAAGLWLLAGVGTLLVSGLWAGTVGPPLRALFWAASAAVVAVGFAVLAVPDPRPVGHLNPDRIGAMTGGWGRSAGGRRWCWPWPGWR